MIELEHLSYYKKIFEMVKKFKQLNEEYNDIVEIEKFQKYMVKKLDKFFDDSEDIDISLKFGDEELNIPLGPESFEIIEEFVQKLKESDYEYDDFHKKKNVKKFNI